MVISLSFLNCCETDQVLQPDPLELIFLNYIQAFAPKAKSTVIAYVQYISQPLVTHCEAKCLWLHFVAVVLLT